LFKRVLEVGKWRRSEMVTDDKEEKRAGSRPEAVSTDGEKDRYDLLGVLYKELEVDLEYGLEQAHVRALVQTNLVLPDVHNQHLARRQGEQGAFALKILVLTALATVGTLHIHNQNILRHATGAVHALVLAHPNALGGLATLLFGHDAELGAEKVVEQRGFARRLRAKDGYEVVVEARGDDLLDVEVRG
jgi:hypothetical protein